MRRERYECYDRQNNTIYNRRIRLEEIPRFHKIRLSVVVSGVNVEAVKVRLELLISGIRSQPVLGVPITQFIPVAPPLEREGHRLVDVAVIGADEKVDGSNEENRTAERHNPKDQT